MLCAAYLTETRHSQEETVLYVFVIGLALCSGTSSLPMKVRLGVTYLECICLLPNTTSLVLLGFNNKRLLEHHWPILCKSPIKSAKAFTVSFILKDTARLVSPST